MGFFDGKERIDMNDVNNSVLELQSSMLSKFKEMDDKMNTIGQLVNAVYSGHSQTNQPSKPETKDEKTIRAIKGILETEGVSLSDLKNSLSKLESKKK